MGGRFQCEKMGYLQLGDRVPEAGAVEPKAVTALYDLTVRTPFVGAAYRYFVAGALGLGVHEGRVLDVGAGPGYVSIEMVRRAPDLAMVGLDLAGHMVELARRNAGRAGMDGRINWVQGDAHRLPFDAGSFDLVMSSFALHHWADPVRVLNEIARVLAPGGRYYVADVCREVNVLQRLFAYASIPVLSLPFGSYYGYGGYWESVRAGYSRAELHEMARLSDLPPGDVRLGSAWLVPIVSIASKGERNLPPVPDGEKRSDQERV